MMSPDMDTSTRQTSLTGPVLENVKALFAQLGDIRREQISQREALNALAAKIENWVQLP